jgi:hypothetical protein
VIGRVPFYAGLAMMMMSSCCLVAQCTNFVQIMTGQQPFFSSRYNPAVIVQVRDGKRPERSSYPPTTFTDPMWVLLVDCWDQNPRQRPDMGSVVQRLEDM